MKILFEKVVERDIDLLMMNKFLNDNKIVNYFLNIINLNNYKVISIEHSNMDENGESDITIILSNNCKKIALLIEDKIDAIAMPEQNKRYKIRGKKGVEKKIYDDFFVFIIAPNDYLTNNSEAQKYEYKVSYESLCEIMSDDIYAVSLFEQALEEKKNGYTVVENKNVTKFWNEYYDYIEKNYNMLKIKRYEGPRGNNAWWPGFDTPVKYIKIMFKADRGFVDLTLPNVAKNYYEVFEIVKKQLDDDMTLEVTGKSLAVRIKVQPVRFDRLFSDYINEIDVSLKAVKRLESFLGKIDYKKILDLR